MGYTLWLSREFEAEQKFLSLLKVHIVDIRSLKRLDLYVVDGMVDESASDIA